MAGDLPTFAVADIFCAEAQYPALLKISNLSEMGRPRRAEKGNFIVSVLADPGALQAARNLGCEVTIVKSAEDYQKDLDAAYASIKPTDSGARR
jgi:hypothetical protein